MSEQGRVIVVSGPSGAGKSTIVRETAARTGAAFSVSATTRAPRQGEVDGKDYRFVDREMFEGMISRGELLEWARVFGRLYGTPAAPVCEAIARGEAMLLDIDVQGGLQVHAKMPDATFVLILPPSDDVLADRLGKRGSESPESLRSRLGKAKEETESAERSGVYNCVVVNDNLEDAVSQVIEIVKRERGEK